MIYDHMIKVNGKYYAPGEDAPNIEEDAEEEEEPLPFSDEDIMFESDMEEKQYTKSDINKMNTADLQELAAEMGIENAYEKTGGELKKQLINVLGL